MQVFGRTTLINNGEIEKISKKNNFIYWAEETKIEKQLRKNSNRE